MAVIQLLLTTVGCSVLGNGKNKAIGRLLGICSNKFIRVNSNSNCGFKLDTEVIYMRTGSQYSFYNYLVVKISYGDVYR